MFKRLTDLIGRFGIKPKEMTLSQLMVRYPSFTTDDLPELARARANRIEEDYNVAFTSVEPNFRTGRVMGKGYTQHKPISSENRDTRTSKYKDNDRETFTVDFPLNREAPIIDMRYG